MTFIEKMFSDSGDVSSMRVMSFFSLLIGAVLGVVGLYHTKDLSGLAVLCGVFVGPSLAGKALQKFAEVKKDGN